MITKPFFHGGIRHFGLEVTGPPRLTTPTPQKTSPPIVPCRHRKGRSMLWGTLHSGGNRWRPGANEPVTSNESSLTKLIVVVFMPQRFPFQTPHPAPPNEPCRHRPGRSLYWSPTPLPQHVEFRHKKTIGTSTKEELLTKPD